MCLGTLWQPWWRNKNQIPHSDDKDFRNSWGKNLSLQYTWALKLPEFYGNFYPLYCIYISKQFFSNLIRILVVHFNNGPYYYLKSKVRQMSAVLLRRIYSSSVDFYDKLAPALQEEMKSDLLQAINTEQLPTIRKKICDAVAELSRSLLGKFSVLCLCNLCDLMVLNVIGWS